MSFQWRFQNPLAEQADAFAALVEELAARFGARLLSAPGPAATVFCTEFEGAAEAAEARAREFWLELHSRTLDQNLALELVSDDAPAGPPRALAARGADAPPRPLPAIQRPPIPEETVYDLLRSDDPDMDRNLAETIAWIEANHLPVINLLSYLELPLFLDYAAEHPDERDQNLFLHMLHTWANYRRWGAVHARIPPELTGVFTDPRYLRLNTTQFQSPAPALCLQFADWEQAVRGAEGAPAQWAKEIYLTHLEPPTPSDDRELTLMIVTHDARGELGFIPLEVPLSLPGVGESIDAFFAPSEGDEELGANTEDLHRLTAIAATYCLYASARDPARYLGQGS
ncbi:MAG: hypothetical protein ACRD1A_02635 [Terriglobales bacterium]